MELEVNEEILLKKEQYLCPANRNHKLSALDKLISHIHTCKEVKLPDQPRYLYYCQYYQGHIFVDKEERSQHEETCLWSFLPDKQYDPQANKISIIQPSGVKNQNKPILPPDEMQKRNYEYALAKGLIKKKNDDDYIPPNSFEFNKDFKKVDEFVRLSIQKLKVDQNINTIKFTIKDKEVRVLSQCKQLMQFIAKRLPYNLHFRERKYYEETYKNQIIEKLLQKQGEGKQYELTNQIPLEVVFFKLVFNNYLDYLNYLYDEYVYAETQKECYQNTESFIIRQNNNIIIFLQIGKDFDTLNNINQETLQKIKNYKCNFSDILAFQFQLDETLNAQLKDYLIPQVKKEVQFTRNENIQENCFILEEKIDVAYQKRIADLKNELEIKKNKNKEYKNNLEKKNKAIQELIEQKDELIQKEADINTQCRKLNTDLSNYKDRMKDFKQKLEKQNEKDINTLFEQKEIELSQFIEKLNQESNKQNPLKAQLFDEIRALKEEKQAHKLNYKKLQLQKERLQRQILSLKTQHDVIPQEIRTSEYYTGTEFIFDISEKIKCKACKLRKVDVVFIPCHHAVLCSSCQEKFECSIPGICPQCEKPVKRVYHFLWEKQRQ